LFCDARETYTVRYTGALQQDLGFETALPLARYGLRARTRVDGGVRTRCFV